MGTPDFAVPSLQGLLDHGHDVAAVVTQPDHPAGRGQKPRLSAVKRLALERKILVLQPEKLRDAGFLERLREIAPEAIVVAAYGKILPRSILELPPRGAINVHGSLLPKYRGAAPIQRALLAGEATTGITIMQMNERMDAGDILLQQELPILPDDTSGSLSARMAELGAVLLVDALYRAARGELRPRPQREEEATLAPMVKKEEGEIDWGRPAIEIERAVRAFQPWPGAYTRLGGKLLKVLGAGVGSAVTASPGTIVRAEGDALEVATGDGALALLELQLEGKRKVGARGFLAGHHVHPGDRLGHRVV
jgi:methionyl-tRNA formyltransferase